MAVKTKKKPVQAPPQLQVENLGVKPTNGFDFFVFNEQTVVSANIRQIWPEFNRNFFGHIERDVQPAKVVVSRLKSNHHGDISRVLREIKLAQFVTLIESQRAGQDYLLNINGRNNIAKIVDSKNESRIVIVRWMGAGNCKKFWSIDSIPVSGLSYLQEGICILSPAR